MAFYFKAVPRIFGGSTELTQESGYTTLDLVLTAEARVRAHMWKLWHWGGFFQEYFSYPLSV